LIGRIKRRLLSQNKNCLIAICGETGSGKSYQALRLGEDIDPNFSSENVVTSAEGFLDALEKPFIKAGTAIVWDEAGVGLPSREWQTIQNKCINYVMQTFRHMNIAVIFTTPNLGFIDVQLRNLFHFYLETQSIDYKNGKSTSMIFNLKQYSRTNEVIPVHPRVRLQSKYTGKGRVVVAKRVVFGLPSTRLVDEYERMKTDMTKEVRKDARDTLEGGTGNGSRPARVTKKQLILQDLEAGLKPAEIAKKREVSQGYIRELRQVS